MKKRVDSSEAAEFIYFHLLGLVYGQVILKNERNSGYTDPHSLCFFW